MDTSPAIMIQYGSRPCRDGFSFWNHNSAAKMSIRMRLGPLIARAVRRIETSDAD